MLLGCRKAVGTLDKLQLQAVLSLALREMSSLASFGSHLFSEMSLLQTMIDQLTCIADNTALKNIDRPLSWASERLEGRN